jgi:hypothetical protein
MNANGEKLAWLPDAGAAGNLSGLSPQALNLTLWGKSKSARDQK